YGTLVGVEPGTDVQLDTSQATALFNNKNVGNNKTVTVSNLDLTGDDAAMYTIGSQTTQANISPRNLTLSNFVANDKVYDGNTIVTGAGFDDDRINDDVLSFTYNVAFENADAGIDKQVLFTNITISGGTDQNNYTLVSTSGVATATITPRPLAITADSKSKKFGEDDPALTYTLTSGSLIGNDTFSGAPEREPGEDLGEYAILQGTLTAGSNYAITFTQGVFTIQPADLIVFIVPQAAITAGAQWSIDGETWYNSGTALPLAPGDYTVQFSEIDANAWYTPDPVSVEHGAQTEITGTYVEKYFLTMLEPQGNGSVTPAPGVYDYPVNQEVNLSATPDDDWVFQHWLINGNTVANNPYNITITENTEVQAVFAEDMTEYLLTLNTEGEGSVLVNGDTYTQPMTFVNGSQVLLEAVAEQGWIFTGWEGDLTGSENPTSIIIDGDKNITATFEFVAFDVTFNIVDDEGDPIEGASVLLGEIINEPGDYVFEDVPPGIYNYIVSKTGYITVSSEVEISEDTIIDVTLVPGVSPQYTITFLITNEDGFLVNDAVVTFAGITNPEGNYVFPGIEAGLYSYSVEREGYYTATGNVSVSADMTVPVVLEFSFYLLEIEHEGLGITVPDVGIYEVDKDTIVTLQAFSVENSLFSKWVVDGNEYFDTQIEFIMDSDKLAVAHFDSTATYKLSIVVEGEGTTIPAEGDYYYGFDQVVELIALDANENYSFLKWVVDGIDYFENQINVVMNDDIIATAIFTENTFYTLDIEIEGEGTTDPEPGVYQYLEGTEIELSAIADEGYAFVRWEINGEEFLTSVISVQMNENKNAKAVFDIESIVDDSFTRFYDVIVYPVPSAETITMRFEGYSGKAFVEIFDLNGRMVRQLQIQNIIPAHEETIMISDLEPGVYSLKIQLQNEIIIKRFIVR
ncbi:MAG: T9SS C-terminal target domain-containing protein, partial [Bacteroidetes bacterium]